MARGEQDPGLVSAAVAWVEAAQALAEAAPGVGGPVAVGQVGAGACGRPWAARGPEARAVRVRVEEPEQGAARAALVGEPGGEAGGGGAAGGGVGAGGGRAGAGTAWGGGRAGGGWGLVGVRGGHGTGRPGRCGSGGRSRNGGRPGRGWLGNREWRRQWRRRGREWWSRWRTWWDRYWAGRGCRGGGGRNG